MIPIHWLTFSDEPTGRGVYWDTALFEDLVDGRLWQVPGRHEYLHYLDPPGPGVGAILVLPGRACVGDQIDQLNALIDRMPWCLLYVTSDEERQFPLDRLHRSERLTVWMSYLREQDDADPFPLGYRPGTREVLGSLEWRPVGDKTRIYDWSFAGQVTHRRRRELADVMESMDGGWSIPTEGFAQGLDQKNYVLALRIAKVAPAPSGPVHVDSFRMYEALEAGCLPVPETHTPDADQSFYWDELFPDPHPWRPVDEWSELPAIVEHASTQDRVAAWAWWQAEKRRLAYTLDWTVSHLAEDWRPRTSVADQLTVLISSSPIPSHPSAAILDETIASVRQQPELRDVEIIVMLDGVRPEQQDRAADYYAYVDEVCRKANHEWTNVLPVVLPDHRHQGRMTRDILAGNEMGSIGVLTDHILFLEHDTPIHGPIPFPDLLRVLDSRDLNLIRLYHEGTVPPPHQHLMLDPEPVNLHGVPVIRTRQWSQRPSLARTDYYRQMLTTYFGDDSDCMLEDELYGVVSYDCRTYGLEGWDRHRLGIYAPEGGYERSTHTDGREGDVKYPQVYEYPGPTPEGAPRAMSERTD